jgi:surface antigen
VLDRGPDPENDAFDRLIGFSGSSATRVASSAVDNVALPTRRSLRESEAAASGARTLRSKTRKTAPVARRALAPHAVEQPRKQPRDVAPVAYSAPSARSVGGGHKKRFNALFTMVAVGGLFASAALPAYALGSVGDATKSPAAIEGRSLSVSDAAKSSVSGRESFSATSRGDLAKQRSDLTKQANYDAYITSGARELGDDYPWFSELANTQGGGLSPLNYYYRECVDFVAWRLNRDAGTPTAPFAYVWSDLTPGGGDARQWAGAWRAHGWPTGAKPEVGAVAWFAGNHVAYVTDVYDDGTILIEEYNHGSKHLYGQRIIPVTDVALFLYAPPR